MSLHTLLLLICNDFSRSESATNSAAVLASEKSKRPNRESGDVTFFVEKINAVYFFSVFHSVSKTLLVSGSSKTERAGMQLK